MKPENSPASKTENRWCILLIDDSCVQARIFSEQAGKLQYTVNVAHTGEQALTLLQHHSVLMAFIELHLMLDNGFSVGQSVINQSQVPCVLLTGLLKKTDHEWAKQLGFIDVLERPLQSNDLYKVLGNLLESQAKSVVEPAMPSGAAQV